MKVKNYLVLKNYKLTDVFFLYDGLDLVTSRYNRMQDILIESAELYLQDCDDIIVDSFTVANDQIMFKHHMELLRKRHTNEPCNILYCDLDMVFIKPYKIFNQLETFSMCSGNCGVRYYPHEGMSEELWNIQIEMSKDWDISGPEIIRNKDGVADGWDLSTYVHKWKYEQDIYNEMLNHTLKLEDDIYEPNIFLYPDPYIHNVYNFPYNGAGLIHCNGTGQQFDSIFLMEELLRLSKLQKYDDIRTLLEDDLYSTYIINRENRNDIYNPWQK